MKPSVLVIDDDPAVLGFVSAALRRYDCTVTTADSAEAALDPLFRETFDLVITDYRLPRLAGDAVVNAVREQGAKVPVMLMTGLVDELPAWLRSGPASVPVLAKPFALPELLRIVEQAIPLRRIVPAVAAG